jgi:hypothetical protein
VARDLRATSETASRGQYALWIDPRPDWDEEKVAEFLAMCASTGAPATPATTTEDAAAMHAAGHAFYQAANGVWLTRLRGARLPVWLAG